MRNSIMREFRYLIVAVIALVLTMPPSWVRAQGMMGRGAGMRRDTVAAAVMPVVHDLMMNHQKLRRTVTNLPDGVRTLTESDDSAMVAQLQHHVATTGILMASSKDLDVPASPTLRQLLARGASVTRTVERTARGVVVTETSKDSITVGLLRAHAAEVTDLVNRGMQAMHEKMMRRVPPP